MGGGSATLGSLKVAILALAGLPAVALAQAAPTEPIEDRAAPREAVATPPTEVLVPRCPEPFGGEELDRLLRLELSLAGVDAFERIEVESEPPAHSVGTLRVRLRSPCEPTDHVILVVSGGPDTPSVHQVLDLTELDPVMRARAMAVAAAEQVRLQRLLVAHERRDAPPIDPTSEPSRALPPSTRSLVVPLPSRSREPPREPAPATPLGAFWVAFETRGFPAQGTWPLGVRIGVHLDLLAPFRIGLDAGAAFASAEHPSGGAELWLLTGGLSVGGRWSLVPELVLAPGVRLDVGYATLAGHPDGGMTRRAQGPSVVLLGTVRLEWRVGDSVALFADVELGPTLVSNQGLAADRVAVIGTDGLAFGARLGFALDL